MTSAVVFDLAGKSNLTITLFSVVLFVSLFVSWCLKATIIKMNSPQHSSSVSSSSSSRKATTKHSSSGRTKVWNEEEEENEYSVWAQLGEDSDFYQQQKEQDREMEEEDLLLENDPNQSNPTTTTSSEETNPTTQRRRRTGLTASQLLDPEIGVLKLRTLASLPLRSNPRCLVCVFFMEFKCS
jgi:Ulp1 family protease